MLRFYQRRWSISTQKVTDQDVLDVINAFSYSMPSKLVSNERKKIIDLCTVLHTTSLPVTIINDIGISPYERDCEIKFQSPLTKENRINVTSISMSKKYCELKNMFRLYANLPKDYSKAMLRGNRIHKLLELKVHEQVDVNLIEEETNLKETVELDFDESVFHVNNRESKEMEVVKVLNTDDVLDDLINDQVTNKREIAEEVENDQSYLSAITDNTLDEVDNLSNDNYDNSLLQGNEVVNDIQLQTSDATRINENIIEIDNIEKELTINDNNIKITKEIPTDMEVNLKNIVDKVGISNFTSQSQTPVEEEEQQMRFIHLENLEEFNNTSSQFIISLQLLFGRLTKLFSEGKTREIRVIGQFDTNTDQLMSTNNKYSGNSNDYITLSGIVDQLEIQSENEGSLEEYLKEISNLKYINDFEQWFNEISRVYKSWDDELSINIRELKTSGRSFIQNDSIQTAYDQVLIYNKLIRVLNKDYETNFNNYFITCKKRGIDIFKPLPIDLIKFIGISNKFLFNDLWKLKNGQQLNYEDDYLNEIINNNCNKKGNKLNIPTFVNDINEIYEFYGDWEIQPTTAHIIGRIVQIQSIIKMSNEMFIDFYIVSENDEKGFKKYFSDKLSNEVINKGMNLWLGKRNPIPTTHSSVCNSCPFQNDCQPGRKLMEYSS